MASRKKKKKRSPIQLFLTIVFTIVFSFCVLAGGAFFAYQSFTAADKPDTGVTSSTPEKPPKKNGAIAFIDAILGKGVTFNMAVFGVDGGETRTDVIFVVHFDSKTKTVNLVSVPRDTYVTMTDEMKQGMDKAGRWYPQACKINEVHAYAGKDLNCEYSVLMLEDLLGIDIDHYVRVNLDGFRYLVDAIGGVDVDVPMDMNYEDPYQDLYIHLKAGPQHLDGKQAEQLVRFRSYPQGDVARVQVQQLFLKAFAEKITSSETIKKSLGDILKTGFQYMKTDLNLMDAIKYIQYISDVDVNNIKMETIPGQGQYIGNVSYYVHDEAATEELVQRMFYSDGAEEVSTDSRDYKIAVLNGGDVVGLAGRKKEMLTEEGFQVTSIGDFTGEKTQETRIIVKQSGMGQDLLEYFPNGEVQVDRSALEKGSDITIVLGLGEEE